MLKSQNTEITDKLGRKLVNNSSLVDNVADNEAENEKIETELASWLESVSGVDVSRIAALQQQAAVEAQKAAAAALVDEKKKLLLDRFAI
jgi:ribosomal protein L17